MAEALHLFVCRVHRFPMEEVKEVKAVESKGFEGCIHGRLGSKRQVLLMDSETLARFGLAPGVVKGNVTTRGLYFQKLSPGLRLRIGSAVFEVAVHCDPCSGMDDLRPGLQEELRGHRGLLCRVVQAEILRRGDAIEFESAAERAAARGDV